MTPAEIRRKLRAQRYRCAYPHVDEPSSHLRPGDPLGLAFDGDGLVHLKCCRIGVVPQRYWLNVDRGYVELEEFPPLLRALRLVDPGWSRRHPREPTPDERAREICEERSGRPAYLASEEEWADALWEAEAEDRAR